MGYHPTRLGTVRIKEQSGWGSAATPSASDAVECAIGFLPPTPQERLQPDIIKASFYEAPITAGSKAAAPAEVTLSIPLHGVDASTPSADVSEHVDGLLLRYALGAASQDGYQTDLTSGSDTTTVNVTSGVEAHSGHAILVPLASGYSIGWISDHTTNAYTVSTLAGTPASSGTILGSDTVYLATTTPANGLTLQWLGSDSNSAILLWDGAVSSLSIDLSAGAQPMMEVGLSFLNWTNSGTGGAPAAAAYTYPQLPAITGANGARLRVNGSAVKAGATTFSVGVELDPVMDHAGDQGRSQFIVTNRTCTLEFTSASTDLSSLSAPGTAANVIQLDACTTPGRAFSVLLPEAVVLEHEQIAAAGNLVGTTITYGCDLYTGDTETAAPADTSCRCAFL